MRYQVLLSHFLLYSSEGIVRDFVPLILNGVSDCPIGHLLRERTLCSVALKMNKTGEGIVNWLILRTIYRLIALWAIRTTVC